MNSEPAVAFPLATSTWDQNELDAINEVIASGQFTMGPRVAAFEQGFAELFNVNHAVMVNSGSSANLLAVACAVLNPGIDLNPGDEVIVPAVSWATTYYPLQQYGLKLVFVDIDIDTLNLDLDQIEAAIGPRTKAIFAVNLLGNPNDFSRMQAIADKHGLTILEDNCESLGAEFSGQATGSFGVMGTFSTFFSHHIATMEGGLVLTNDERCHQMLVSMRAHGWTRELPDNNLVHMKTGERFDDLFRFVLPGYNVRPLEISGALGSQQLKKIPEILTARRANARLFLDAMATVDGVRVQREIGRSSWFGFSLILEGPLAGRRKEIVNTFATVGIECRPIVAGNFTRNPVMRYLDASVPTELPNADRVHYDGLFVGNHHYSLDRQIALLTDTLRSVIY
ncbi:DegT/DnrJ/EryC1/StrS family aminotransferase [Mycolicibacterium sp. CH28]|uniref:DegT/DnrJ/EryC1/StrS family aminotransferase n=1 Tax=Mycolicibacterium sp. CH28 TaxID=2512237 RepID=UPI00108004FA|nr:DegT/DnrJ/EryC1/StrS family aminotransferase [Mycolicibacterium sp. CH28]TGD83797.1 DegT/DnrJ/EryC1/StrS family aminotransferase [Mycolicibacterium sp. CH28]